MGVKQALVKRLHFAHDASLCRIRKQTLLHRLKNNLSNDLVRSGRWALRSVVSHPNEFRSGRALSVVAAHGIDDEIGRVHLRLACLPDP